MVETLERGVRCPRDGYRELINAVHLDRTARLRSQFGVQRTDFSWPRVWSGGGNLTFRSTRTCAVSCCTLTFSINSVMRCRRRGEVQKMGACFRTYFGQPVCGLRTLTAASSPRWKKTPSTRRPTRAGFGGTAVAALPSQRLCRGPPWKVRKRMRATGAWMVRAAPLLLVLR